MIRAKTLRIREFRGIRDLTLDLGGKNFAICGPNGTGKSGIVDALEFVLTGNISRLSGAGTGGLSVKEHGPHVDSRNRPDQATVTLTAHVPSLKRDVSITRSVRDAKKPRIVPDDASTRAVLDRVATHPEFTLSRRELIKYVLAEPGKRAKEVQEILRLDEVESVRTLLQRIANACDRDVTVLRTAREDGGAALRKALAIAKLSSDEILVAANEKRALLALPALPALDANTSIKDGTVSAGVSTQARVSKAQAKSEIEQLRGRIRTLGSAEFASMCVSAGSAAAGLTQDEQFLRSTSREAFLRSALAAFDERACPVCDTPWDAAAFRQHLQKKLERFAGVTKQREALEKQLVPIASALESVRDGLASVARLGVLLQPPLDCAPLTVYATDVAHWRSHLQKLLPLGTTVETLSIVREVRAPALEALDLIDAAIANLPEPSQQDAARDFLSVGQEKLEGYRQVSLKLKAAEQKAVTARFVFETYGRVTTEALENIYSNVEAFFSRLYRSINRDDEEDFQAQLTPSLGKLGFDVDFYGRGFFPPGAYHSEGHQDGMGLCLYLALMNHLAGPAFTFAVLDDVLMSVDAGHRREVSKMLLEQFPNTQFILTTHDEIWLRHMKTVGLIEADRAAHFRSWNVAVGPTEWSDRDVWTELNEHLSRNDVRAAAALLRNYLEHFSKEACQELRAQVEFRGDAQFVLGDLLPNAVAKMKSHLKVARVAAQSWGQDVKVKAISERETQYADAATATRIDQWQVNAAVHYNEWANLQKNDFQPVVDAFKNLIEAMSCQKCSGVLYATPNHGEAEALRCGCGDCSMNLLKKRQSERALL